MIRTHIWTNRYNRTYRFSNVAHVGCEAGTGNLRSFGFFQDVLTHHIRVIFCGFSCWISLKKKFSNPKSAEKRFRDLWKLVKFHEMRRGYIGTWKLGDLAPNFLETFVTCVGEELPPFLRWISRRYPELIDALLFRLLEYLGWWFVAFVDIWSHSSRETNPGKPKSIGKHRKKYLRVYRVWTTGRLWIYRFCLNDITDITLSDPLKVV